MHQLKLFNNNQLKFYGSFKNANSINSVKKEMKNTIKIKKISKANVYSKFKENLNFNLLLVFVK